MTYCGALTVTTLYFFGTAAIANVHSVILIDVGRSSGAKDTLATYEYSDLYNEKHYKIEGFAPVQKVNVGSKIDILFLKQLPDIAMAKSGVKIMAKESVSAIFIAFSLYFEASRRLFFLKPPKENSNQRL